MTSVENLINLTNALTALFSGIDTGSLSGSADETAA